MICTYYSEWELANMKRLTDKELDELYQDVKKEFGEKIYVKERKFTLYRGMFRKPEHKMMYSVLYFPGKPPECQQINFYQESGEGSINEWVGKSAIAAYMMGLLAGKFMNSPIIHADASNTPSR